MTCTAARHGTVAAYKNHHCRCPLAVARNSQYDKQYRQQFFRRGRRRTVPAVGVQRRLRALAAAGWRADDLAPRLYVSKERVRQWWAGEHGRVSPRTATAVAAVYDELAALPGPSERTRRAARRQDWAPPEAWTADTIDDPAAQPWSWDTTGSPSVDEVAVQRALAGEHVSLPRDERGEALVRLIAAGLTPSEAGRRLRLSGASTRALLDEVS